MRIAVSAENDRGLESPISPHFGRCPYFALVDVEGDAVAAVKVVANPFYGNHQPGQVPAFVNSQEAGVMVSGGMGAAAINFFNQYGIGVATGAAGTVGEAVQAYLNGQLSESACCPGGHHH